MNAYSQKIRSMKGAIGVSTGCGRCSQSRRGGSNVVELVFHLGRKTTVKLRSDGGEHDVKLNDMKGLRSGRRRFGAMRLALVPAEKIGVWNLE